MNNSENHQKPIKRLYLLTSAFPYGDGEQFIETEINYLSRSAETIIVIPAKLGGERRNLPSNVIVYEGLAAESGSTALPVKILLGICLALRSFTEIGVGWRYNRILMIWSYYRWLTKKHLRKLIDSYSDSDSNREIVYSYWFNSSASAAIELKNTYDWIRVVSRAHGGDVYPAVKGLTKFPFRKSTILGIDRLFCISKNGREHIGKKYGFEKITVCRLGVLQGNPRVQKNLSNTVTILSCSFVHKVKNVDKIMQAVCLFAGRNPDRRIRWVHIGDGPLLAGIKEKAQLCTADVKNIDIEFLGRLGNEDVRNYYREKQVDCFLNLSSSEGIPVSIMEAISFGVPVVATDVGGTSEIVTAQSGRLISSSSELDEVVDALEEVIDTKNALKFRRGAFSVWQQCYDADKNYNDFCYQLESLVCR